MVDTTGKSAEEIVSNRLVDHSSWHFFQASSWLDLAKRTQKTSALHYAAFELRYGIEYLLFELLVLATGGLTEREYQKCLGSPGKMKKMLRSEKVLYDRRFNFTRILMKLDPLSIQLHYWDLDELFCFWGKASELLHFVGAHSLTYNNIQWFIKALAQLESIITEIWRNNDDTIGVGVIIPEKMDPDVKLAWEAYSKGQLSDEELSIRMNLISPILKRRRLTGR